MISTLFKKLASLPGINWFNRKEKITYEPAATEERLQDIAVGIPTYKAIMQQNYRYFTHINNQAQYIKAMHKLIDQFDGEVRRWDEIQLKHESELQSLKDIIRKRDITIQQMQKPGKKIVISDESIDRLIAHLVTVSDFHRMNNQENKNVKRAREYANTLHSILQKLKDGN